MRLLTTGNPKTAKGTKYGYHTGVLHLHPDRLNCRWWSKGCRESCLNTAGRGGIFEAGETTNYILEARKRRNHFFHRDPERFTAELSKDIRLLTRQATGVGLKPAIRLNGTSDLDWTEFIRAHPDHQFYDYTKSFERMRDHLAGRLPKNYHLTFSRTEANEQDCRVILSMGGNVAIVTMTGDAEAAWDWAGPYSRVPGDTHDLTFLHAPGTILVLRAKGRALKDTTGFVLQC